MGEFYGSIHVRTESYDSTKRLLEGIAKKQGHKFYLSPPIDGWISFFPAKYGQIPLGLEIAKNTRSDVLQLLVHDDDIFCYWYYRDGRVVDEYNSRPGYFGEEVTEDDMGRLKGRAEVFSGLLGDPQKIEEIREILKPVAISDDITVADNVAREEKKLRSLSKEIDDFIKDPEEVQRFLSENPGLFEEEMKSLAEEASSHGMQSLEQIQKSMEESGKAQDCVVRILAEFMRSRTDTEDHGVLGSGSGEREEIHDDLEKVIFDKCPVDDAGDIRPPAGLFASETMNRFAEVLGIRNAVTSYEYLADGDTDNICGWDQFIEIS